MTVNTIKMSQQCSHDHKTKEKSKTVAPKEVYIFGWLHDRKKGIFNIKKPSNSYIRTVSLCPFSTNMKYKMINICSIVHLSVVSSQPGTAYTTGELAHYSSPYTLSSLYAMYKKKSSSWCSWYKDPIVALVGGITLLTKKNKASSGRRWILFLMRK